MQDKKRIDIKVLLLALANHLNVDKIRGLADFFEIPEGTIYAWIKRGKIGNTGAILSKAPYVFLKWLETGEGPMCLFTVDKINLLPQDNFAPDTTGLVMAKSLKKDKPKDEGALLGTAEEAPPKTSDREFKALCAASFDPVFEYIAEEYGKNSLGIADFLDDLRDVHHAYRAWRRERREARGSSRHEHQESEPNAKLDLFNFKIDNKYSANSREEQNDDWDEIK